jgi:hypothetical protein
MKGGKGALCENTFYSQVSPCRFGKRGSDGGMTYPPMPPGRYEQEATGTEVAFFTSCPSLFWTVPLKKFLFPL